MPLAMNPLYQLFGDTPFDHFWPIGDPAGPSAAAGDRLVALAAPGTNPGGLDSLFHRPDGLADGAALVVVLHGCKQTAGSYDAGSGWSRLADALGFAVLYPQQQRANNPNLCFNWFDVDDATRGSGEAESIRQMIAAMIAEHGIDPRRIFITGLSAGGAMASIMLATYPELFAGGAIIAGLPFGATDGVSDAFARMRGNGYPSDPDLGRLVKAASGHQGPWPTVSVWHGTEDLVVSQSNADRIVGQWLAVHGLADDAAALDMVSGTQRRTWRDGGGRPLVTAYAVAGMGHGTPLETGAAEELGISGPFMLEAGISSTCHIAEAWGLCPLQTNAPTPEG